MRELLLVPSFPSLRRWAISIAALAAAALTATALPVAPAGANPVDMGIRVSGNRLLRDGEPWVPKGFTMVGALSPTFTDQGGAAAAHLNDAEMEEAKAWGADSLRFQVSQRGLDPLDTLSSTEYVEHVRFAVDLARRHGLAVMLSIQDQGLGGGSRHPQPSDATLRDWATLTAMFNDDPYVMYEIFNEPQNHDGPADWAVWRDGGPPEGNQGTPAVGHQAVLNAIRATGSENVVLADGARFGTSLLGVPMLDDPLGQVAYALHPYMGYVLHDPAGWDDYFGYLTSTVPVVATEWNARSASGGCQDDFPQLAPQMLQYLEDHNIGLFAWALDYPGTLIRDWTYSPTTMDGFECGRSGSGVGELVKHYYLTGNVLPPSPPPPRPATKNFTATADAKVDEAKPKTNYGKATGLRVDKASRKNVETYLRFQPTGLEGQVHRAVIQIYASSGTADGPRAYATSAAWRESGSQGINWNTRPARGVGLGNVGKVKSKTWVEIDVTAAVRGNGDLAFVLVADSSDGMDFNSREKSSQRPKLVVTTVRATG